MGLAADLKEGFLGLFFPGPSHCPLCGGPLISAGDIPCLTCRRQLQPLLPPFCPRCGKPLAQAGYCPYCHESPYPFLQARAAGIYAGVLREAIHLLKYKACKELLPYLQHLLGQCLTEHPLPQFDVIVPVPLHRRREWERGFNQAALLAAGLGRQVDLPVDYRSLIRRLPTPPTHGLSRREREETMGKAFSTRGRRLQGKAILLVDDILTTGATASGCSTALLQGGAAAVYVLTVATVPKYK